MAEIRKCVMCGKPYIATKVNSKYCGAECQTDGLRIRSKRNDEAKRDRARAELLRKNSNQKAIINIAVEAKKAGMSYGQYVAKMGL